MAQVIIAHSDGRRYEVSEQAFADLYEPFGFSIEGVLYNGAVLPNTEANLAKANEGAAPAPGDTTAETQARAVILSDLEAEARQRLAAESAVTPTSTEVINPNAPDTSGDSGAASTDGTPEASPPARPATGKAAKSGEGS